MKKFASIVLGFLTATSVVQAADTIELDAGVLRTATGAPLTSGLLQIIALRSPTGVFAAPTSGSFIGGDTTNELVVASFAFKQGGSGFATGETDNLIQYTYENQSGPASPTTFDAGDELMLRWYPTLTIASTSPGTGTTYGQYRSNTGEGGGIAWYGPADGQTLTVPNGLNFLTMTAGGANLDLVGDAVDVVLPIPEPATWTFLVAGALGLVSWRFWVRRPSASVDLA